MKAAIHQSELAAAVAVTSRVCSTRPANLVESAVLLVAGESRLTLTATDYKVTAESASSADVMETGRAAVSGSLLAAVAKVLPKGQSVELVANGSLEVRAGAGSWRLPLLDADIYPASPKPGRLLGTVDAAAFGHALSRTLPLLSNPTVPGVQGAAQLLTDGGLTVACTDTYRLGIAEVDWTPADGPAELTIPGAALKLVADAIKGATEVELYASDGAAAFGTSGSLITVPLLAKYVPWQKLDLDPEGLPLRIVVDVKQAADALARATAVLDPKEAVRLTITSQTLTFAAPSAKRDTDAAQSIDLLDWDDESPREFVTVVNPAFFREALTAIGGTRASLFFPPDPNRPFLLRPAGEQGEIHDHYRHIFMPIRQVSR
ncbi:MAG TPA: DNA polymerase III subunit beta [Pseudonocardiaceae bacterium]|nr:DNA polymerase III subunit beta [Pseudonocardiaceae bacterium]